MNGRVCEADLLRPCAARHPRRPRSATGPRVREATVEADDRVAELSTILSTTSPLTVHHVRAFRLGRGNQPVRRDRHGRSRRGGFSHSTLSVSRSEAGEGGEGANVRAGRWRRGLNALDVERLALAVDARAADSAEFVPVVQYRTQRARQMPAELEVESLTLPPGSARRRAGSSRPATAGGHAAGAGENERYEQRPAGGGAVRSWQIDYRNGIGCRISPPRPIARRQQHGRRRLYLCPFARTRPPWAESRANQGSRRVARRHRGHGAGKSRRGAGGFCAGGARRAPDVPGSTISSGQTGQQTDTPLEAHTRLQALRPCRATSARSSRFRSPTSAAHPASSSTLCRPDYFNLLKAEQLDGNCAWKSAR